MPIPIRSAPKCRRGWPKDDYSLNAQVKRTVDRCDSLRWTGCYVYRYEPESSKHTDRPMFQRMLGAARNRAFDVVAFW